MRFATLGFFALFALAVGTIGCTPDNPAPENPSPPPVNKTTPGPDGGAMIGPAPAVDKPVEPAPSVEPAPIEKPAPTPAPTPEAGKPPEEPKPAPAPAPEAPKPPDETKPAPAPETPKPAEEPKG